MYFLSASTITFLFGALSTISAAPTATGSDCVMLFDWGGSCTMDANGGYCTPEGMSGFLQPGETMQVTRCDTGENACKANGAQCGVSVSIHGPLAMCNPAVVDVGCGW